MREFSGLDADAIRRDVLSDKHPAVFRGLVRAWPAVAARTRFSARPGALSGPLRQRQAGRRDASTPPEIDGRIFYNEAMSGFNFLRNRLPLAAGRRTGAALFRNSRASPAVAAQSALIRDCLPGFAEENRLSVVDDNVLPRIWLGNADHHPDAPR